MYVDIDVLCTYKYILCINILMGENLKHVYMAQCGVVWYNTRTLVSAVLV